MLIHVALLYLELNSFAVEFNSSHLRSRAERWGEFQEAVATAGSTSNGKRNFAYRFGIREPQRCRAHSHIVHCEPGPVGGNMGRELHRTLNRIALQAEQ